MLRRAATRTLPQRILININFHSTGLCMGITMLSHVQKKKYLYIHYYRRETRPPSAPPFDDT